MASLPPDSKPPSSKRSPSSRPSGPPKARPSRGVATSLLLFVVMLAVPISVVLWGETMVAGLARLAQMFATSSPSASAPDETRRLHRSPIHGTVKDESGESVAGASVHLVTMNAGPNAAETFALLGEATTDAQGTFAFPKAYPDQVVRVFATHDPEGVGATLGLHTTAEAATDVEVVLSARETIRGTVVDAEGAPVAQAEISVNGVPWAATGLLTDERGAFTLTTVPHEAASLSITARGYSPASFSLANRASSTSPAALVARIVLRALPKVEGDVSDSDGNPTRATVVACESDRFEARTTSAADGTFELPPSATGCQLVARSDNASASEPVLAVEGRRVTLRLNPGGSIEGVVVDERGEGVSPFSIGVEGFTAPVGRSERANGGQKTFSDRSGSFHLDGLAPGTYVLSASAPGKPPTRSDPIPVKGGSTSGGVRIVLTPGGVVIGHVYDEKHTPLGGVDLRFDQASSVVRSTASAKSDESGAYRLEGAPAGPFTVQAQKEGFRVKMTAGLYAPAGAPLTVDITLSAADSGGGLELGGIGASMQPTRAGVVFRTVFPGDPADRAGAKAGDFVLAIDGESTEGQSMADVLQKLRGEAGTTVGITVQRGGEAVGRGGETLNLLVTRALIVH